MLLFILTMLTASGFDDPKPYSPNDVVLFALADAQALDPTISKSARYLSLAHMPPARRARYSQTLDFVLNSLSRRQSMIFAQPVAGSNGSVLRILLTEYKQTGEGWETIARRGSGPTRVVTAQDQPEPYFTINLEELTGKRHRRDKDGDLLYWNGDRSRPVYDEGKGGLAAGTWFNITAYTTLRTLTSSEHPILRADWFIGNATLDPGYSEMLGIKTLDDFNRMVRFRPEDQDLSGRAIVADSQLVSLHQRGIEYTPKVGGSYWQTYDYKKGSGINDLLKDPLKRKRDAGEIFAELPNGLQAFSLVDQNNKIIDVADGNIVSDQVTGWKNKLVWNGLYSCTNCHKDGARDILDEFRPLTAPPRALVSKKAAGFQEIVDAYSKNLEAELANTRTRYAVAVTAASRGLKPIENTEALNQAFLDYQQKPLTLADAAAETGCTPDQLRAILSRIIEPDPAITTLLAGRPLRRDLWEAAFPLAATAVWKELKK